MKIVIVVVLFAVMIGGFYAALPHVPELRQIFQISNEAAKDDPVTDTTATALEPSNSLPVTPTSEATGTGSLAIVGADMYLQEPSFVIVKNSGTDAVLIQIVAYGQTTAPVSNLRVEAGGQQQIAIPKASGIPGSSYVLQVHGISESDGKSVTAQVSVVLQESSSRLEVSDAKINVHAGGNSALQLTVKNSGSNPVSIVSIECGTTIPIRLWAQTGHVVLQPGGYKQFDIQLDSTDCAGTNPTNGSIRKITVRGENSLGKIVSAVADCEIVTQVQQQIPLPASESGQLVGTKLPMGQAMIRVQSAGHYVLTFEVVNTHYQDVRIDSLKVNGAEIPGWGGSTLLAQTSMMSTVTTSQGITSSDIGSTTEVVILAHLSTSSQYGDPSTSFYAIASAPVLGP